MIGDKDALIEGIFGLVAYGERKVIRNEEVHQLISLLMCRSRQRDLRCLHLPF